MFPPLLTTKRFLPFFLTQFTGAFNDNLFKNALVVLLTFHAAHWTTLSATTITTLASGLFILPFFVFSAVSAQIANKYPRNHIAQAIKLFEMAIMALVGIGFYLQSFTLLMVALFLFGTHSTFFGPVKYAILPQHLKPEELLSGNALVESGTFLAILIGTLSGSALASVPHGQWWITTAGLTLAAAGWLFSKQIPHTPAIDTNTKINWNILTQTQYTLKQGFEVKETKHTILTISWFWLFGLAFLSQFPVYAKQVLHSTEMSVSYLLMLFTLGIGIGSLLCDKLSKHQANLTIVAIAGIGMSTFTLDLAYTTLNFITPKNITPIWTLLTTQIDTLRISIDLLGIGIAGGIFCVPLYTLLQTTSTETSRAAVIASNNIVNSFFMVIGSLTIGILLSTLNWSFSALFVLLGCINLAVSIWLLLAPNTSPEYKNP